MSRRTRWLIAVAVVVVVAVTSHAVAIVASPRIAMGIAQNRIADQADGVNRWMHTPRVNADNQQVVRSSPDLAYSACSWDLSDGPVTITANPWEDYYSLSLYDSQTNNFFVANDRTSPAGAEILLATEEQAESSTGDVEVVVAPSETGVALLRYLAPTPDSYELADRTRRDTTCEAGG